MQSLRSLGLFPRVRDRLQFAEKTNGRQDASQPIWQTAFAKMQELLARDIAGYNPPNSPSSVDPEMLISRLSFSHLAELVTIENPHQRTFYELECIRADGRSAS